MNLGTAPKTREFVPGGNIPRADPEPRKRREGKVLRVLLSGLDRDTFSTPEIEGNTRTVLNITYISCFLWSTDPLPFISLFPFIGVCG